MTKKARAEKARRKRAQIYRVMQSLYRRITDQQVLDGVLLEVDDVDERYIMFETMKPHLRFPATFPTH